MKPQLSKNILLINKPGGMTSHDVVDEVRRVTGVKKVGHAGTLDPMATGLLILLVGRDATHQQTQFLHLDKVYEGTAQLGLVTDTGDRTGTVLHTTPWDEVNNVTEAMIHNALKSLVGSYDQQVQAYSAVKVKGKKLYDLARHDKLADVELPSRKVDIKSLELLAYHTDSANHEVKFDFRVECSSGTYIRSLIEDLGKKLDVGATLTRLNRVSIGPYQLNDAVSLIDFTPERWHNGTDDGTLEK